MAQLGGCLSLVGYIFNIESTKVKTGGNYWVSIRSLVRGAVLFFSLGADRSVLCWLTGGQGRFAQYFSSHIIIYVGPWSDSPEAAREPTL